MGCNWAKVPPPAETYKDAIGTWKGLNAEGATITFVLYGDGFFFWRREPRRCRNEGPLTGGVATLSIASRVFVAPGILTSCRPLPTATASSPWTSTASLLHTTACPSASSSHNTNRRHLNRMASNPIESNVYNFCVGIG